jgi:hypothetical protein
MCAALVVFALGGCSSNSGDPRPVSGSPGDQLHPLDSIGTRVTVTGHLKGVGGPAGAFAQHWRGTIHVKGPVHMDVATDAHGRFQLRLPPGHYVLTGHSPQFGDDQYPCQARDSLVVTKGAPVRMDVLCEMK